MLEVRDITITGRYGRVILDTVRFSVSNSSMLAIIGPNGAGKSTLVKAIAGLVRPHHGGAWLDSESLASLTPACRAQRIAYLPQATTPVPCSVFDAVLLGRKPHMGWMPGLDDRRKTESILSELRLDGMSNACVTHLSGGELQKVLIARALVQDAPILILDEPVNHLDIRNQVEILDCIASMTKKRGLCTIIVLHTWSFALREAQNILLLHNGIQRYFGLSEELTADSLTDVFEIPISIQNIGGVPYALF